MEILELLTDFYKIQRELLETDTFYLISSITISLVIFFFSKKSSLLSLFPLVTAVARYISLIYEDYPLIEYFNRSVLRFLITSYILTYALIYFTKIALMIGAGLAILHYSDKYSQYLDIPYYNWVMFVIVGVTFYNVKRLQNFVCTIVASIYSSLVLLNGIELLAKQDLGMENLNILGLALTSCLAFCSVLTQNFIHKSKAK